MNRIYSLPKPKNNEVLSYLVLSDLHDFALDTKAYDLIIRYFKQTPIKQRRIILLGDILDFPFLMDKNPAYKQAKRESDFDGYFVPEMEAALTWWYSFFEDLVKLVKKPEYIHYMMGNHEDRANRAKFRAILPHAYAPWFDLRKQLKVKELGFNYYDYNTWLKIASSSMPNLLLTHGFLCGNNPIKKHHDIARTSCLFGHTHEAGMQSFKSINKTVISYNNPCLCLINPGPKYMEGRPHNWSTGATFINQSKNSYFVNTLITQNDTLITPTGELLK